MEGWSRIEKPFFIDNKCIIQVGPDNLVTVSSQEEIIKTRNITEKIDMDSVASIMASCY